MTASTCRHRPARHRLRSRTGTKRWEAWRPTRRALPARRPAHRPLRAAPPAHVHARWPRPCATTSATSRPRPRCGSSSIRRADRGTSRRSTPPARLRAAYPFDTGRRGLPRPHHDRLARRADLPLPADRVAPHSRAPAPDQSAARHEGRAARARSTSSISISRSTTASPRASRATSSDERSLLKRGIATRSRAFNG